MACKSRLNAATGPARSTGATEGATVSDGLDAAAAGTVARRRRCPRHRRGAVASAFTHVPGPGHAPQAVGAFGVPVCSQARAGWRDLSCVSAGCLGRALYLGMVPT